MADRPSDNPNRKGLKGARNSVSSFLSDAMSGSHYDSLSHTFKDKTKKTLGFGGKMSPVAAAFLLAVPTMCLSTFGYDDVMRAYIGTDSEATVTLEDDAGYHAVSYDDDTYILIQDKDGQYSLFIDNHRRRVDSEGYRSDYEPNKDRAELIYVDSPREALRHARRTIQQIGANNVSYTHYSSISNMFADPDGVQREGFNRSNNIGIKIGLAKIDSKALERWKEFEEQINETGYGVSPDEIAQSFSFDPMEYKHDTSNGVVKGFNHIAERTPHSAAIIYGSWLGLGLLSGLGGLAGQANTNAANARRRRRPS